MLLLHELASYSMVRREEGGSPGWVLLHRKSPFQIDDVTLVLKHSVAEGDLQQRKQETEENMSVFF